MKDCQKTPSRWKKYFEELPLHDASYKFKFVSHSLPLAMNMRREKRFRERGWICLGCNGQPPPAQLGAPHPWTHPPPNQQSGESAYEKEGHVINCWAYSDIITGHGLDTTWDTDMIKFLCIVREKSRGFEIISSMQLKLAERYSVLT